LTAKKIVRLFSQTKDDKSLSLNLNLPYVDDGYYENELKKFLGKTRSGIYFYANSLALAYFFIVLHYKILKTISINYETSLNQKKRKKLF
jgi:hypothetical protein